MSFADLRSLHRLHLIDAAIVEIRKRAAALEPGKAIQAEIAALQEACETATEKARGLAGEQADLDLKQRTIDAKIAQIDKDVYGGKVVNPREVEALQKEIEALKRRRSDMDGRLLEIMEELPAAKAEVEAARLKVESKRGELAQHQKKVVAVRTELEAKFKEVATKRAEAAALVPQSMVVRYDAIRQKAGGVGMAEVVRGGFCGMCGTHLPEKLIEGAKDGRIVTCESCHRILFASEGLV